MAMINSSISNTLLIGTSDDDTIRNGGYWYEGNEEIWHDAGSEVTINTGAGNDSVYNDYNGLSITINTGAGNDSVFNGGSFVTINGGEGEDYIYDFGNYLSINGGEGNDYISGGSGTTINGGNGDDTIDNRDRYNYYGTISGDAGNDSISNIGTEIIIDGGTDNDTIENYGSNVTINGGDGNDYIYNSGSNVLFTYTSGDGNDVIEGFNSTSKLQIGDGTGTYSTTKSGSNIIVTVGEGKITLSGAASLSAVNISGVYNNPLLITGTEGADTINNSLEGATMINALGGNDSIVNYYASSVSIAGGDGADYISNCGSSNVTIDGGAGDDTIDNRGGRTSVNGGAGNDSIISRGFDNTITGGTGNDSIDNTGENVTIQALEGDDYIKNYGLSDYTSISGGTGDDSIHSWGSFVTINGGTGNDLIDFGDGTKASNNLIQYTSGDGNDLINFFNATNTLQIGGGTGTYSTAKSGSDIIVTVGEDKITLSGAANLSAVNIAGKENAKNAWKLNGTTATYGTSSKTLVTVSGVKSLDGLSLSGTTITLAASSLNQSKVTVSDGYTLALASGVSVPSTKKAWSLSGTTATYNQTSTAAYTLASDAKSINYTAAANKTLATVSGIKSLDGLSLNGTTITLATSSLNQENITVSNGYTLALASGVSVPSTKKAWSLSGTTATYNQTSTAAYTLASDAKSINYTAAANKTLATVSGIKSTNGLSIDGKVITVSKAALGTNKVTVSDGYTLALAKNVTKTSTKKAWSLNKTTASYKQTNAAGYKLSNNVITYTKKAIKTLATVSGVKAINGLSIDGKIITVSKTALGTNKVTVSDGYTLALAKNVTKTSTKKAWSLNKTTASYKQTNAAGYKLSNNVITYTKKATKTLATVTGVKATNGLSIDGKVITVSKAALGTNKVTVSDGYTLALAKNVTKTSTKKTWSLNKTTASYNQATTAGYKLAGDAKSISYAKKATKTLATVSGVKSTKGFTLSGETIELATTSLSSKVTVSSDDYGFDFASTYKKATITGSGSDDTITSAGQKIIINGGAGNDSIVNKGKNSTINAGAGNDTVVNSGADTMIRGGKGNDSLIGGKGKDIFVYAQGDGNDVITNYNAADRISIESSAVNVLTNGNNVVFTVGIGKNQGKITLQKAKGKTITYFVGDEEFVYPNDNVKYNAAGTAATLKAAYTKKKFEPSDYSNYASTLVTIDASAIKHTLKITGNDQANKITGTSEDDTIYGGESSDTILSGVGNDELHGDARNDSLVGGAGDDSLWGGKGSDTLFGGDGSDTFIYQNGDGKDTIADFARGDVVMILSGKVGGYIADKSDVIFKIGTGQITFQNSIDKYIELVDKEGNRLTRYNPTIFSS